MARPRELSIVKRIIVINNSRMTRDLGFSGTSLTKSNQYQSTSDTCGREVVNILTLLKV